MLPKVCIIGAGCSGFTTAKALADRGIPFDCFDMSDQIGGNWVFKNKNGRSACYQSLHIDTSKYRMQFEDLPIPSHFPDYPHHSQVLEYFNAYVDRFGLRKRITFNTEVTKAELMPDKTWRVTLSNGETRSYGALVVANGHHWDQYIPSFPGTFDGPSFHSHRYIDPFEPVDMRGKRILVVGMGNSAMDIASELSQKPIAKRLVVAARRGVWIFPKYINGKVPDKGHAFVDAPLPDPRAGEAHDHPCRRAHEGLRASRARASSCGCAPFGVRRVPDAGRMWRCCREAEYRGTARYQGQVRGRFCRNPTYKPSAFSASLKAHMLEPRPGKSTETGRF
ncbi:flavin-containing monooxygenase [Comamonas thiooxydans]|uniref:Putative flavin-binding monooxygenase n=2 Tax=Pseudomonadota TaxID=1224 RepID=Q3I3W7_PSEPU|nr:NAD(P)/FAD-dependent oxidoreductase [Comamonas thiooxydans]AAU43737.2 putative flavin-binding monooxygenase [Comamonas testosteroni CNB-1]ABA55817.1 putative flavin-binding monooxygenase [Pseudomonas putida]